MTAVRIVPDWSPRPLWLDLLVAIVCFGGLILLFTFPVWIPALVTWIASLAFHFIWWQVWLGEMAMLGFIGWCLYVPGEGVDISGWTW